MKNKTLLITLMLMIALPLCAITPGEVMGKVTSKIKSSKGLAGHFTGSGVNGNVAGTFRFDGKRSFMDILDMGKTWFDGKTMWILNPRNNEVTISIPTAEELRDANPILYLNGYESQYNLFFSKRKENGRYLVLLNPRKKGTGVKAIEIAINAKTFQPERIIVRNEQDQLTTVTLTNISYSRKFIDSDFTFPTAKYRGYEIIDLR